MSIYYLKGLHHFIHIPMFKMCTIKEIMQLFQHTCSTFSINLKDICWHIHIVKYHCHFLEFVWQNKTLSMEGVASWIGYGS